MGSTDVKELLYTPKVQELFGKLYGAEQSPMQTKRYEAVVDGYVHSFGDADIFLFSSPGRTEISGNHTDHNHGKVIGGSINLDCVAAAAKTEERAVHIISETFQQDFVINLDELEPSEQKAGTQDLVKGLIQGFLNRGCKVEGFNVYMTSNVIASAGVSSSAAFETLLCQIINTLFNEEKLDTVDYAHIGKYAENVYWDKASGLLDQMCCAVGGLIAIDFENPEKPLVKKINYDFSNAEHSLIIVQTGRGHADLSADYSSIPQEMNKVAEYFGKKVLREISIDDVLDQFSKLRAYAKDRAVLRALHFFEENERVDREIAALEKNDFESFLKNIAASGNSSWKYLQNCYTTAEVNVQGISLTLALSERFLEQKGCGVCRVHGGGFAGVIMAMVPDAIADEYIQYIERYMGEGNAHRMRIRPMGSICVQSMLD